MSSNPFRIQEGSVRDDRLKGFTAGQQAGDSLVLTPASGWLGKSLRNQTIVFFYIFLLIVFILLFGRAFYLEVVAGQHYLGLAEGNRLREEIIKAPRGIIYDRFHKPLVKNSWSFYFYINPSHWPGDPSQAEQLLSRLRSILSVEISPQQLASLQPVLVAEKIDYEVAMRLLLLAKDNPALTVLLEPTRDYTRASGLASFLGYVGQISGEQLKSADYQVYGFSDVIGQAGIEKQYEKMLRGRDGYRHYEIDALGHDLRLLKTLEPQQGLDVTLTIDLDLQEQLYQVLSAVSASAGLRRAAAVVMDPFNGEILAMVSLPDFDNNLFTSRLSSADYAALINDSDQPLFMRTVAGEYPPGSTFKIVVAGAALQEGIIDDKFTVNSVGGLNVNGYIFPDWRPGGHGLTNIYKALADSVNTFFYLIGGGDNENFAGLGLDRIITYAKKFGLGSPTGIDLPSEADGFLPSAGWKEQAKGERWFLGDTYHLAIGQGDVLVTPLQIAQYTALVASQGQVVKPHLLKSESAPSETVHWIALDNLRIIKQALRQTILTGSATSLQSVSVPVAGKTGTAQYNVTKPPHSWFTGFAPYDEPELALTILVEEGGEQGLAVRAARLFLERFYNR